MKIGSLILDQPLMLAPMDDITDRAFRLIIKRLGADVVYTEFTSSDAIIRDIPRALDQVAISDQERPVAIQLFGGDPQDMAEAVRRVAKLKPDIIDINCGCWVKSHVAQGAGAALLRDVGLMERIIRACVAATDIPITVKTRLGWDAENIIILEVARMVEAAGAQALAVHCRTRNQAYTGRADWSWLEKIKKVITIPLIGNGDVVVPEDIKRMFECGCDGVMIGRGAIHNPWIFMQGKEFLRTGVCPPLPSLRERLDLCIEHLHLAVKLKGVRGGILPFRKHYVGYLRGFAGVSKLRGQLMTLTTLEDIVALLTAFRDDAASLEK